MLRSRTLIRSVQALSRPVATPGRCIHSTAPVLKKKGKAGAKATEDDAFDDGFADDDLFGGAASNQAKDESVLPKQQEKAKKSTVNADAKAAKRAALFETERAELMSRLAPGRDASHPKAKKTAIRSILRLTDTPAQLWMVTDLIADMRKAKIGLHEDTAKDFFGRCIALNRTDIALQVLTERPRFRLDLDLNTARDLLHSIFVRATYATPLIEKLADEWKPFTASHYKDALLVAGLYPHFRLGEAAQDPIASALLMSMFATGRSNPTSDLPEMEGLATFRDVAMELGKDLLKNTRSNQLVHLSAAASQSLAKDRSPFLRRHQVWLDSELCRADVMKVLTKLGFDSQSLTSLGVSTKTVGALSADLPTSP